MKGLIGLLAILFLGSVLALPAALRCGAWRSRTTWIAVLGFGALFRFLLLPAGLAPEGSLRRDLAGDGPSYSRFLLYDNDVWRYLWEGHVVTAGGSPYANTPAELARAADEGDTEAEALFEQDRWWEVFENTSYRRQPSVYPPVAQLLFALSATLAPASAGAWKLLIIAADLVTCWALVGLLVALGRRPEWVLLYAWNPMAIKELSGSGHIDAFAIALTVSAAWLLVTHRGRASWFALSAAIWVKLAPLLLVPLWLRHGHWKDAWVLPASSALFALPFLPHLGDLFSGLTAFRAQWVFNPGPWLAVRSTLERLGASDPGRVASTLLLAVCVAIALGVARGAGRRGQSLAVGAFLVLGSMAWLSSAVMPWYLLWALPFAVLCGVRSWLVLVTLSSLSYLHYIDHSHDVWWLVVGHGVAALCLAIELGFDAGLRARLARAFGSGF